jgi:hypothetical protein
MVGSTWTSKSSLAVWGSGFIPFERRRQKELAKIAMRTARCNLQGSASVDEPQSFFPEVLVHTTFSASIPSAFAQSAARGRVRNYASSCKLAYADLHVDDRMHGCRNGCLARLAPLLNGSAYSPLG